MRRFVLIGLVSAVVILLVVAQLILPSIAAHELHSRLSQYGTVDSVQVHAFPAVQLLWHHADSVKIQMASYRSDTGGLRSQLSDVGNVGSLDATAAVVRIGLLTLRDASLQKRGQSLSASARVTEADLRDAVPFLQGVQPVASGSGQLTLRGTATVLGVAATADATVAPQNGALVVTPDLPFGSVAAITLFSDPHVQVQGVDASPASDGFRVHASGRLS